MRQGEQREGDIVLLQALPSQSYSSLRPEEPGLEETAEEGPDAWRLDVELSQGVEHGETRVPDSHPVDFQRQLPGAVTGEDVHQVDRGRHAVSQDVLTPRGTLHRVVRKQRQV